MRIKFPSYLIALVIMGGTPALSQLPPEILADSYLLEVEQAFHDGDYTRAWAKIQEILRLKSDHDLNLPELDFWQAQAADSMDLPEQALESVLRYLTVAGREGQHYIEALKLMNKVQAIVRCKGWETEGYFKEATNEAVLACLGTGIDLETRNDSGRTALHRAAGHTKYPAVIEALVKAGADLEALDNNADSPLAVAVVHNENPRVIATLLRAGANPKNLDQILEGSVTDPKKLERVLEPVLSKIADRGKEVQYYAEMLELMTKVQAVARCEGWESEEYFESAPLEEVMACLDTGVDLEDRDERDRTPLHRAAAHANDPSVVGALLSAGARTTAQDGIGRTALHYVTGRNASLGMVEALLAAGADPMARPDRKEIGQLGAGDAFRSSNGAYQDGYGFVGFAGQDAVFEVRSRDFDTYLIVQSPSGERFANDDYGGTERSRLSLRLDETGEYQVLVSSFPADKSKSGSYSLRIGDALTPLHLAARNNEDAAVVEALLSAGADPRKKDVDGRTAVHHAALNQNPAVFQTLLTNTEGARSKDDFGRTPTHYAAQNKNLSVIKILIAAGGNPKTKDKKKWRPLHYAAAYNENPAVIQALLNAGAKLEEKADDGYRALHLAAINNENPAVTRTLIDAGAKIRSSAGSWRNTPLRMAARSNANPEVVKVLINAGGDLHDGTAGSGSTALHYAAVNENPAVTQALIDAGANPKIRDDDKDTPLHYAAMGADDPVAIKVLIDAGADLESRNNDGYTPLHHAAKHNENSVVIEALLKAGANPRVSLSDGRTPLHHAAAHNENPAVVKALLDAGADLEARNDGGNTPLHYAARSADNPAGIQVLVDAGAKLEARNDGQNTPLHQAAWHNENPSVIEALLKAGANPNVRVGDGRTPLHHAAMNNENPAVIKVLLETGANPVAQSNSGSTALDYAVEHNDNSDVAQSLTRAGSTRTRQEAKSGPGWLEAAIGIAGGTAIATAGGGSEEALAAGTIFAEGVISGQSPDGITTSAPGRAPTGNVGASNGSGQCEIPGYPRPADVKNLGLSWCPATVEFQARVFALQAAGAKCAIATGSSSTPEQIQARRQEIQAACERLAALGVSNCQCP